MESLVCLIISLARSVNLMSLLDGLTLIELVSGDEEAIISPEKQQARSVNKIAEFIDLNKN